jgi:hypothetical protein
MQAKAGGNAGHYRNPGFRDCAADIVARWTMTPIACRSLNSLLAW